MATDIINLTGLQVWGRHGVFAEENRLGQPFVIDVSLTTDFNRAADGDDIGSTLSYADIADGIAKIVSGAPVNLIETLAVAIADWLLMEYGKQIGELSVTVHKPHAPIPYPFQDVSVTVKRSGHLG